jgi:hypothetical protein
MVRGTRSRCWPTHASSSKGTLAGFEAVDHCLLSLASLGPMTREHVRLGLDNPRKALLQHEPVPHSSGRDYRLRSVNSGRLPGKP